MLVLHGEFVMWTIFKLGEQIENYNFYLAMKSYLLTSFELVSWALVSWAVLKNSFREHSFREHSFREHK